MLTSEHRNFVVTWTTLGGEAVRKIHKLESIDKDTKDDPRLAPSFLNRTSAGHVACPPSRSFFFCSAVGAPARTAAALFRAFDLCRSLRAPTAAQDTPTRVRDACPVASKGQNRRHETTAAAGECLPPRKERVFYTPYFTATSCGIGSNTQPPSGNRPPPSPKAITQAALPWRLRHRCTAPG